MIWIRCENVLNRTYLRGTSYKVNNYIKGIKVINNYLI